MNPHDIELDQNQCAHPDRNYNIFHSFVTSKIKHWIIKGHSEGVVGVASRFYNCRSH